MISHLDADGLCSASLVAKILLKSQKRFHLSVVKQLEKEMVDSLEKEGYDIFVFTDIGSGQLNEVKRLLDKAVVIVIDHHPPREKVDNENLVMINPHSFGIDGGNEISASTIAYLLAKEFGVNNSEHLSIIGSIGDMQEANGELNGMNKIVLDNSNNKIKVRKGLKAFGRISKPLHKIIAYSTEHIPDVSGDESSAIQFISDIGIELKKDGEFRTLNDLNDDEEKLLITSIIMKRLNRTENPQKVTGNVYTLEGKPGLLADAHEFATILNSCGRQQLQSIGIMLCLGENRDALAMAQDIMLSYKRKLMKSIKWFETNSKNPDSVLQTENAVYIIGKDSIPDTMIGTLCSIFANSEKIERNIIVGFADSDNGVKVSGRVTSKINFDMGNAIETTVKTLGGEGGGHGKAGGAKIKKGQEIEFIKRFEQTIKNIKG
ncbi:MAG: DHH family phosphoesterase [Candidatus Nanoarchaeia archaeon]|nr:DHH family phosphoesterase [Candidatus Nanoarchaeia archaeon]MDD5239457.1 DHH family phosphoesterase [Candidatus Nanoarchaeia archaeon]